MSRAIHPRSPSHSPSSSFSSSSSGCVFVLLGGLLLFVSVLILQSKLGSVAFSPLPRPLRFSRDGTGYSYGQYRDGRFAVSSLAGVGGGGGKLTRSHGKRYSSTPVSTETFVSLSNGSDSHPASDPALLSSKQKKELWVEAARTGQEDDGEDEEEDEDDGSGDDDDETEKKDPEEEEEEDDVRNRSKDEDEDEDEDDDKEVDGEGDEDEEDTIKTNPKSVDSVKDEDGDGSHSSLSSKETRKDLENSTNGLSLLPHREDIPSKKKEEEDIEAWDEDEGGSHSSLANDLENSTNGLSLLPHKGEEILSKKKKKKEEEGGGKGRKKEDIATLDHLEGMGWIRNLVENSSSLAMDNGGDSKHAFGSDDEPTDEEIREKLEEVQAIEDALLLRGQKIPLPERSGYFKFPWQETAKRYNKGGSSGGLALRTSYELLNPMNNPLLQDPDMFGPSTLTKSDKELLKALQKMSFQDPPPSPPLPPPPTTITTAITTMPLARDRQTV